MRGYRRKLYIIPNVVYEVIEPLANGERIAGFKCPACGSITEANIRKPINAKCVQCANKSKGKQSNNTSGYIGVFRRAPGKDGVKNVWAAIIQLNGKQHQVSRYKDVDFGGDQDLGRHLCAIDRDQYIIANDLPYTRNFTDMELEYLLNQE